MIISCNKNIGITLISGLGPTILHLSEQWMVPLIIKPKPLPIVRNMVKITVPDHHAQTLTKQL